MIKSYKENRKLVIIECPTNLGLSMTNPPIEPGVGKLPQWLKKLGFHSALNPAKTVKVSAPIYKNTVDPHTLVRNSDEIVKFAIAQSEIISQEVKDNNFLLVLGGDCSLLIGSALALKQNGTFGLFYLDGHTDYITPQQSHTHGAAGMDLAISCGLGHPNLTNIKGCRPYFQEEHVFCVGNREYDEDYERPVLESNVHYFPLNKLRNLGIDQTIGEFFNMLEINKLDGFFVHLDVDVLDNEIMPAVDSPQTDGLSYQELAKILEALLSCEKAMGIEITILDPDLDPKGKYTQDFIKHIVPGLKKIS